ncbi:E3 ubiquitin-protein ligase TRIM39-like [Protopterus annectens]|uniref:E3 ubiquitin-protein ligase TRIM39-like n=1 Tax=Protopterus annectens TaxID=7888 RepID=UPI001CF9F14F|nr:E3 ubiquitin-protein ligase TRIM39-like [Protopterus annectens]
MAALQSLEDETVCAVCLSFFTDPVITECGHNFCKTCILQVLRAGSGTCGRCPECRSVVVEDSLRSDKKLGNITEMCKQIAAKKTKPTVSHMCKQHQENLKLFCRMDNCPICVVCHVSSKHKGHEVMPIEEAVEQYKGLLTRNLSALRAGLKSTTEYQNEKNKKLDEIKKSIDSLRKNVISEFGILHQLLNEEQNRILGQLDAEEKMCTGEIISNLKSASEKSSSIDKIIKDTEERLKLQDAEFLRDIHGILNRTGFDLRLPEEQTAAFPIHAFSIPPYYLIWKKIKRQFSPPDRITPVLDQNTAHRFLILSKDKSTVSWKNTGRKSCNQDSFNFLTAVLGREKFSSKKYVWTLEVDGLNWALGVVNKSVIRYGNTAMIPANGFWVLRQVYGNCYAGNILLRLKMPPTVQLAVYLDYERGQLTIYRRDTLQHIYTFQYKFSEKLLPFFYVGKDTIIDLF